MPSGAKRRKAAKKKKDKKASNSDTTSSVGNEDLKHESDEEHNEQHFSEGEEEEVIEKREDLISRVEENKSSGDVENQSEGADKPADREVVIQIERESKLADDFDKRRGSSNSNSSSSDDESRAIEKDILVVGNAPVIDNVEVVGSLTEVPIQVCHTTPVSKIDNSAMETAGDAGAEKVSSLPQNVPLVSDMVELEPKENRERKPCAPEESDGHEQVVTVVDPEPRDEVTNVAEDSAAMKFVANDGEDKLIQAYNESEYSSVSADNSLVSGTVESELKETGERELSSVEESGRLTEVVKDMAPEKKNDEVPNAAAISGAKELAAHNSEGTPPQAYNTPRDDVVKDREHETDSEVLGSSTGQAIGLRPVQTTSWKSCCGLFELFAGSNR